SRRRFEGCAVVVPDEWRTIATQKRPPLGLSRVTRAFLRVATWPTIGAICGDIKNGGLALQITRVQFATEMVRPTTHQTSAAEATIAPTIERFARCSSAV